MCRVRDNTLVDHHHPAAPSELAKQVWWADIDTYTALSHINGTTYVHKILYTVFLIDGSNIAEFTISAITKFTIVPSLCIQHFSILTLNNSRRLSIRYLFNIVYVYVDNYKLCASVL